MSDDDTSMNFLAEGQVELLDMAMKIQQETDGEKIMKMAKALKLKAKAFEARVKGYAEAERKKWGEPQKGSVVIKLTDAQRQRIGEETGLDMEELVIEDAGMTYNILMENMTPPQIEMMALKKARAELIRKQNLRQARAQMRAAIREIEKSDHEEMEAHVRKIKEQFADAYVEDED